MATLQQSLATLHSRTPSPLSTISASAAARSLSLRCTSSISSPLLTFHLHRRRRSQSQISVPRRNTSRRSGPIMMGTASSSYAAALAEIAKSTGTLEATSTDMEKIGRLFSDESLVTFFTNPTIPLDNKLQIMDSIGHSSEFQLHTTSFLKVVVEMRRIEMMVDMANDFETITNKITGTETAVVTSVVPLDSSHLAQIARSVQKLTKAKNVKIKTEIDPKLVAGFTIRYGNSGSKLIDMSVKKQLEEIASKLEFDVQLVGV